MPIFNLFSSKSTKPGKTKITAAEISEPYNFRHELHLPLGIPQVDLTPIEPARNLSVSWATPISASVGASNQIAPEQALRDRVLQHQPAIPCMDQLTTHVRGIGRIYSAAPAPSHAESLASDAPVRALASHDAPAVPVRSMSLHSRPASPPRSSNVPSSMPRSAEASEASRVGRGREVNGTLEGIEHAVAEMPRDASFLD